MKNEYFIEISSKNRLTGVSVLENWLCKIKKVGFYCKIDGKFPTDWCECELGGM